MAAPRYISTSSPQRAPSYSSPDVVPHRWRADRPADLADGQPVGGPFGYQGPDQGYALRLTELFEQQTADRPTAGEEITGRQIILTETDQANAVQLDDVHAGCVQIGLKRASLHGRAPVVYDLEVAYRCWGWLDSNADTELVDLRGGYFRGMADSHHYTQVRRLVAAVPAHVLLQSHTEVAQQYETDWRQLLAPKLLAAKVPESLAPESLAPAAGK